MLEAIQLGGGRITPTRRGVLSGSDIVTLSRLRLEQAVAPASELFSAAGEERASARWLALAVRRFIRTNFETDIVATRSASR
jgi:hypothetical protein